MCSLGGTCTECETCETIPNYPGLSSHPGPTFGVNVFLGWYAPNVRHVRPPQLSWTVLWPTFGVNVFLGRYMHRMRHVRPSQLSWTVLNLAHLWCKCVPWEVHAPNVRHVRPSPTILDCPQLSWPTFGVNVFLGWYMHRM
jgi:hypothetical protein